MSEVIRPRLRSWKFFRTAGLGCIAIAYGWWHGEAYAQTSIKVTILVDLPVNTAPSYCSSGSAASGDSFYQSSAQIGGDGISTKVPSGSGLRRHIIIDNLKGFTLARQAIAINAAALEQGKTLHLCLYRYALELPAILLTKSRKLALYSVAAKKFQLYPAPKSNGNFTCSPAGTCTITLPLHDIGSGPRSWNPPSPPDMHWLYIYASSLLDISEADYLTANPTG